MNEIMLDLETLGIEPGCAILSIGAVFFDSNGIGEKFYQVIDLESSMNSGFTIRPATLLWWFGQEKEALNGISKPGKKIIDVLKEFSHWVIMNSSDPVKVWGNGSDFDNAILGFAYSHIKYGTLVKPWGDFANRCYRTIKTEFPQIKIERVGEHHNALDDAISQANHLIKIRQYINSCQH